MFEETRIKKKVDINEFLKFVKEYNEEDVECTIHTFFRLSEKQRKIYTPKELTRILTQEIPFLVGFQYNENYAVFYRYKDKILKLIVNLNNTNIKIVTFFFIQEWQIPKI